MKTLIGIPTFGGLPFTRLCVKGIRETVQRDHDLFAVVGKPNDDETAAWLTTEGIAHTRHDVNLGFPAALNDIYDCFRGYDAIVIIGNDVIPYPSTIDTLIELARTTDWEVISANQLDVQTLCRLYQAASMRFSKDGKYTFDFQGEPWRLHEAVVAKEPPVIVPGALKDVHNLCIYKKSMFAKVGYVDANFWPAYFSDNDYARRMVNANVKYCSANHAQFFHFWSRTINQGEGHPRGTFDRNAQFYHTKWGGVFGSEKWTVPFDGKPYTLPNGVVLPGALKIESREHEREIAEYWRSL